MTNSCCPYIIKFRNYFFPSFDIFNTLCMSYDKTRLFIVSFIRLLIYLYIFDIVNSIKLSDVELKKTINYFFHIMIIINIFYLLIIILKQVESPKYIIRNE